MATRIVVDTTQIEATKKRVEGFKNDFHSSWTKVMKLKDEIDATWDGTDNDAFNTKVEGFRNDFTELETKIQDYIDFLTKAKTEYDNAQSTLEQKAKSTLAADR